MRTKMNILKIIGIAAGAVAVGVSALAIANPGNSAETSADAKDENLRPRKYRTPLENFVAETEKIIPTLSTYGENWKLISGAGGNEAKNDSAVISAEVPVVVFTDDLKIKAESDTEEGFIIVNIRSASRVGKNDLGENRRHITQILQALDEKFTEKK